MAGGRRFPRRRSWIRRRRVGAKLASGGDDDPVLSPGGRTHCGEWRCVRGVPIRLEGRMRVGANGDVYVPDSEDEESVMEVEVGGADVADSGGATATVDGMRMAIVGVPPDSIAIGSDKEAADVVHVVAESILADGVKVAADEGDANSVKVAADATSGDKMHPKVVARLEKLLRRIDPTFRDIFVDMLKVMVPAFFDP
ncbi:unnamed protein product [Urochloa humidicola]